MPGRRKNGGETIFTFYADECRAQNKSMAEIPKLGVRLLQVANGCEHGGAVPGARGGRGEVGAGDICTAQGRSKGELCQVRGAGVTLQHGGAMPSAGGGELGLYFIFPEYASSSGVQYLIYMGYCVR